jgi:hypothetical protein
MSARATPSKSVGGAIGAALCMLLKHGLSGGQAAEVASALALLMYEMSGRGLGLRQVLRLLALLVQKDTY